MKGEVAVCSGRGEAVIRDGALRAALIRAYGLQAKAEEIEAELKRERGLILKKALRLGKGKCVSFGTAGVRCTVTPRREAVVPEEKLGEARRALGKRFYEFVRVERRYIGRQRLIEDTDEKTKRFFLFKELSPRMAWE